MSPSYDPWLNGHFTEPADEDPEPDGRPDIAALRADWTAAGRPADHAYIATMLGRTG